MEEESKGIVLSTVYISYSNLIRCIALNVHVYHSEYSHFSVYGTEKQMLS